MSLKEILMKLVAEQSPVLLSDSQVDWEVEALLENLSDARLRVSAYMQPGLYIAEINEGGYLGRVLFKVKARPKEE